MLEGNEHALLYSLVSPGFLAHPMIMTYEYQTPTPNDAFKVRDQ